MISDLENILTYHDSIFVRKESIECDNGTDMDDTPILVIEKYTLGIEKDYDSTGAAISLVGLKQNPPSMRRKCWLPNPDEGVYPLAGKKPKFHAGYKSFHCNGIRYYPYSIDTSKIVDIASVVKMLEYLRQHQIKKGMN